MSASTELLYIVVPRWDEFQHRDMARSTVPPWIKTYTRLLSDETYLALSGHRRAVLHGLWLEYARTRRQLTDGTATLSRRLALRVSTSDLEALSHAGFIHFSASKVAGLEVEVEVEREVEEKKQKQDLAADAASNGALSEEENAKDPRPTGASSSPSAPFEAAATSSGRAAQGTGGTAGPSPGGALAIRDEWRGVYDHWRVARRKTNTVYDRPLKERIAVIQTRLRRFTADQLCRAIDGVAADPWEDRPLHDDLKIIFRNDAQVEKFLELAESGPRTNGKFVSAQDAMTVAGRLAEAGR